MIARQDTRQAALWEFLWSSITHSDMFTSHSVPEFDPQDVPEEKVGYHPASTDWINGRNKPLKECDLRYYFSSTTKSA